MSSGGISLATVYWGADADADERSSLAESLKDCLPNVEVEMLDGGQPHYDFIISLE
jgi:dihydroxyacetone kinase-like predicted kinase